MNRKTIIIAVAVIVAVALGVLYVKFTPVWASLTTVAAAAGGLVVGWIAHILYAKYVK
ncbi:MAG TPA: hypothetical protein H9816_06940 [Candidatus Tidjanibacter faecipullorum]|uniref:Uncharacterized protein n=1 Tax=Candidatus Tidjanibacter faecipullorum TaxID=2838766 RepID=A0A9D2ILL8_9BACT|nr:hypothetical protein [Candidatus Tidjanibacter faecipullorum]